MTKLKVKLYILAEHFYSWKKVDGEYGFYDSGGTKISSSYPSDDEMSQIMCSKYEKDINALLEEGWKLDGSPQINTAASRLSITQVLMLQS